MSGFSAGQLHVLHVDDKPDFAEMAADFLEREDDRITVETVTGVDDALDHLAEDGFDCVVSDYDMPGMDGIEFLETVRENDPDLPFILFTGKGSEEVASEAIASGVTDYLQKGSGTERYELLANRVRNAVQQYRANQRAANLERVRALVNDINQALVRASSRRQIETEVCDILTGADPYRFAVVAGIDSEIKQVTPRTWSGAGESFLEDFEMSVAEGTPGRQAPGGRAYHDRELAVAQNLQTDPAYEPWRDLALDHDFQALAVVPLDHEDEFYGLLAVFADRPNAFDETERALLAELGDDIAHAIDAVELRAELEKHRTAVTTVPEGVFILDKDGMIELVNESAAELVGYSLEDLRGEQFPALVEADIFDEEVIDWYLDTVPELVSSETDRTEARFETEIRPIDGKTRSVEIHLSLRPYDEEFRGSVGIIRDITERKEREQALAELNTIADEITTYDSWEAVCERTIEAAETVLNFDNSLIALEEDGVLSLTTLSETFPSDAMTSMPVEEGAAGKTYRTGESLLVDDLSAHDEAKPQEPYRSAISVSIGDHGVFQAIAEEAGTFDETDVKFAELLVAHTEQALGRIERDRDFERYETIVETLGDPVYALDAEGRYTFVNDAFVEETGYARDEVLGEHVSLLLSQEDIERSRAVIQELLADDGQSTAIVEAERTTADGEHVPVEIHIGLLPLDDDGRFRGTAGVARDISDRKEREQELERYEAIIERMPDGAFMFDRDGNCIYVNRAAVEASALSREELLGTSLSTLLEAGLAEETTADEVVSAVEEVITGEREEIRETLAFETPGGKVHADGYTVRVESEDGEFIGVVSILRDITQRVETERELRRQNERLNDFVSFISHDLRNPLNVVEGNLELAREECDSDHLDSVADALARCQALIDNLLTLAREGEQATDSEPVDLAETVDRCWRNVETDDAMLVTETDRTIRADRSRLQQLLENLIRNAVEHGGEDVTVRVGDLDDGTGFYVEDDGPGIPENERDQVFESGYSTSERGTGFGLAIVKEIATAHGWGIHVTDGTGGGVRFEITGVEVI